MWYASCSAGAHWIPSTAVPGAVVSGEASGAPFSSGIPSKPSEPLADGVVEDGAAAVLVVLVDELEPQPAAKVAAIKRSVSALSTPQMQSGPPTGPTRLAHAGSKLPASRQREEVR